jgi:pimeloyl-ACP methyl ester carboxylesterase
VISRMIEELDLGRPHLIGVSYGGAIVLNLAARYPGVVNKVVSIEGGVVRPEKLPGTPVEYALKYPVVGDLFIALARTGLLNRVLLRLVTGRWYPRMTADDKAEFLDQLSHNAKSASRIPWYWISVSHKTCEDFVEAAKSMRTPVLYLYGTESDFMDTLLESNIRFLETSVPHVRVVGLKGGIHDLEFQKPREVADLVLQFFAEE